MQTAAEKEREGWGRDGALAQQTWHDKKGPQRLKENKAKKATS